MNKYEFTSLTRVNKAATQCVAEIRSKPEYFQVNELLPFAPEGSAGHVWLNIQKRGINTDWLAMELAKFSGVKPVAVGYEGLSQERRPLRLFPGEFDWQFLEDRQLEIKFFS